MERRFALLGRPRAVAAFATLFGIAALVTPLARPAAADPLASARAQAAQLTQKINDEQQQVENLSNQYDAAQLHLQQVQNQVKTAQTSLSSDQSTVSNVRQALTKEAVDAYTAGGFVQSPAASPTANLNPMVASSYFEVATGNQTDTVDQYRLAERKLSTQQQALGHVRNADSQAVAALASRRQAAQAASQQATATLSGLNSQIAQLVAQQQAQERAQRAAQQEAAYKAQLAQQQQLAAQQQQQQQAAATAHAASVSSASGLASGLTPSTAAPETTQAPSTTNNESGQPSSTTSTQPATSETTTAPAQSTTTPTTPTTTAPVTSVPGVSGAAGIAVSVAMAQLGKPYQWGAEGPGSFDCSGLVAYSYAAAGIHLDHYTGAQWAETTQIPFADAQAGDLVFFNGLGHVGIYLGGGMMVDAPNSNAVVRVESIYGFGSIDGFTRVS